MNKNSKMSTELSIRCPSIVRGNEHELLEFLSKNSRNPIKSATTSWKGGILHINVDTKIESQSIKNLNNKKFKSEKMEIRFVYPKANANLPPTSVVIESLTKLIKSRYDPNSKFLNLETVIVDPLFLDTKMNGFPKDKTSKMGPVLCKIIEKECPDVQTISFAKNKIESLYFLDTLFTRIPNLLNVSFKDNLLSHYRDIEPFKGSSFQNLREVIMDGNPVKFKELLKEGGDINFKSNIKTLFPSITVLDGDALLEEIQFGVSEESMNKLPAETLVGFSDSPGALETAQLFLQSFLDAFDNNRQSLECFYSDNAQFSLMTPDQERSKAWQPFSRNLQTVKLADKRVKSLYQGPEAIMKVFNMIPKTKHPITDPPEEKKFIFDTYQVGAAPHCLMYIFLHGVFCDGVEFKTKRAFDRTFILMPSQPGSRSAIAGLPISILNDSLTIRFWNLNLGWKDSKIASTTATTQPVAQPQPVASQLPPEPLLSQYQVTNGLNDVQHQHVIMFSQGTGLNYQFSLQCLNENSFNLEQAHQMFQNAKGMIPPEAFLL
ncbi:hypothetical protein BC833DRAFT_270179 [Globomyces pollinis-pini]|nr:hypothetical protein BC833DRAFT_270179 [Globomyces pollinis-pini]